MSKVPHTPGPWSAGCMEYNLICVDDGDAAIPYPAVGIVANIDDAYLSKNIASVDLDTCDHGEAEANARLIAAAPELLDALTAFVHDPDDPDSCFCGGRFNVFGDQSKPSHSDACNKARAAIAKATGKEAE